MCSHLSWLTVLALGVFATGPASGQTVSFQLLAGRVFHGARFSEFSELNDSWTLGSSVAYDFGSRLRYRAVVELGLGSDLETTARDPANPQRVFLVEGPRLLRLLVGPQLRYRVGSGEIRPGAAIGIMQFGSMDAGCPNGQRGTQEMSGEKRRTQRSLHCTCLWPGR